MPLSFPLVTDVYGNAVRETTTTTGAGTVTLAGADTSAGPARTFAAGIGANNTCPYRIDSGNGTDFEVGIGTVGSGGSTFARTTIIDSTNVVSGVPQAISLTGTSKIAAVIPGEYFPFPVQNQGTWNDGDGYPAYAVANYLGADYLANEAIPAPGGSVTVSSPTTSRPTSSTTWTTQINTSGPSRFIFLVAQIPNQTTATAGTITGVSSPNVVWQATPVVDHFLGAIGFDNYVSIWAGQAGAQLVNEPITVTLGTAFAGNLMVFDIEGLNLAGTIFDPNSALPNITVNNGPTSITASFTTSNADDLLLFFPSAGSTNMSATPPSGFTLIGTVGLTGNNGIGAFYEQVSATQSSVTVTAAGGGTFQACIGVAIAVEAPALPTNPTPPNDTRWQLIAPRPVSTYVALTANYQILKTDSGLTFTNHGASGSVTAMLPNADGTPMEFEFIVDAAHNFGPAGGASDKIALGNNNGSTGGTLTSADPYSTLKVKSYVANQWVVTQLTGDWS